LLQSQDLIGRTIDSLPKFRVDFYKKLQFKNRPMYASSPIDIDIISISDISYGKYYLYQRKDNDYFTIKVLDNEDVELETVEGRYNEPVGCKYFLIKVIENNAFRDVDKVHFRFRNRQELIAEFSSKLAIQLIPNTSVLNISVLSDNPLRDVDFLTAHAQSFLDDNLDKKNYEADKTIQFINDQLGIISDSLSRSESNLNSFKVANKMYGQNNTSILTERMELLENQGKQIRLRDEYFKYLKNYLKNNIDNESLASPTTIGIQEPRLIALVDKYNELQIKLLDLGVKNPQYDVVMSQIRQIKTQLNELINSVSDVYKIEKSSYQSDWSALNKLLVEAPNKELRMLDYERRYKINDSYLGNDNLSHGKVAAKILEKQVMLNREIVDAVSFHTTAREGMSLMEKIVFLADAIEENRTYDGVDEIRDLAFENIDAACLKVLENTVQHLADKGIKKIDRDSIKAICWFKEILNKRRGDKA